MRFLITLILLACPAVKAQLLYSNNNFSVTAATYSGGSAVTYFFTKNHSTNYTCAFFDFDYAHFPVIHADAMYPGTINTESCMISGSLLINNAAPVTIGDGATVAIGDGGAKYTHVLASNVSLSFPAIDEMRSVDVVAPLDGVETESAWSVHVTPSASVMDGVNMNNCHPWAWVSGPDQVTVRWCNNRVTGNAQPGAGNYLIEATKFVP